MSRVRAASISLVIVATMAVVCVLWLDRQVAVLCRYGFNADQYRVLEAFTVIGDAKWWFYLWAGAWIFCAALALRGGPSGAAWVARRRGAGFLFLNMVVGGLTIVALKWAVGRYRPIALFEHGIYGTKPFSFAWEYVTRSFPSGHAQAMFSLATPLAILAPRWRPLLFLFASLIGLTRALMAVHYISDVLVGAYIGAAMTYVVLWGYERWIGPVISPPEQPSSPSEVPVAE